MFLLRFIALLLALTTVLPVVASAQPRRAGKLDKVLADAARLPERPRVIVRYREGSADRVRQRLESKGARGARQHRNALSLDLPAAALKDAAADPDVLGLSVDALVFSDGAGERARPAQATGRSPVASFDAQALRQTLGIRSTDTG